MSSHIRVDNLQNVAILEYRSKEGEVVRQYPSESQIAAFQRAQEIHEQARTQQATSPSDPAAAPSAPVAAPEQQAAPAPAPTTAVTTTPAPALSGGGEGSTSVVV